jgi:hypothetical protein
MKDMRPRPLLRTARTFLDDVIESFGGNRRPVCHRSGLLEERPASVGLADESRASAELGAQCVG